MINLPVLAIHEGPNIGPTLIAEDRTYPLDRILSWRTVEGRYTCVEVRGSPDLIVAMPIDDFDDAYRTAKRDQLAADSDDVTKAPVSLGCCPNCSTAYSAEGDCQLCVRVPRL